ncbi:MAG: hypothetical protein ACRDVE_18045 [Actinocrinis sp.]
MTSRRGELLRTQAVQICLNALQPSESSFYGGAADSGKQSGVFLVSESLLFFDSYWSEWVGDARHRIRRRVLVSFEIQEDVIDMETP